MPQSSRTRAWVFGLIGSILMFAGWVLAIVPAFHHLHRVALVVAAAIIGFGLVLIPAGVHFLTSQSEGGKRGPGTIVVSMLPSAVIFFITVAVIPLGAVFRVLAILCEIVGMAVYGWSWGAHSRRAAGAVSPDESKP